MVDNVKEKLTQFKEILKDHVQCLKPELLEPEINKDKDQIHSIEPEIYSEEIQDQTNEEITVELPMQNNSLDTDCLMLCGRILRIMGDEITCRACGKTLRNIGDEIFCSYATKNIMTSLLLHLSKNEAVDQNAR